MATSFLNFNKKHAVAGSSKLKATDHGHIFNIKVKDETLDNGTIISKGAYVEPEVYEQGDAPATFAAKILDVAANGNYYVEVVTPADALLVLQVPLIYENYTTRMQYESNFFNVKDDIVRAYELYANDVFELSKEGFDGEVAKGDAVTFDVATMKLKVNQG